MEGGAVAIRTPHSLPILLSPTQGDPAPGILQQKP